jgi:hypothetical protein
LKRSWVSINSSPSEVFCLLFNHSLCDEQSVQCGGISVPCFHSDSERGDLYQVSPNSCQRERKKFREYIKYGIGEILSKKKVHPQK